MRATQPSTSANRPVSTLARCLVDAREEGLHGWESVNEALRSHVRGCLRSGDKEKVCAAINHVKAAADAGAPILAALRLEAQAAPGTAEWDTWRIRDADTAESMQWYVLEVAKEAAGTRDWSRARDNAEKMMTEMKR